jgi:hypothetical protein
MDRRRDYCFAINNYTTADITSLEIMRDSGKVHYMIIGENGTHHIHGYVYFKHPKVFGTIKKLLPRAHFPKDRGSALQNKEYCSKQKIIFEYGELPKQGARNDIDHVRLNSQSQASPFPEASAEPQASPVPQVINNFNNCTIQIQINNFGNETVDHFINDIQFMRSSLQNLMSEGFRNVIAKTYFDTNVPQNNTVVMKSMKRNLCEIFTNDRWEIVHTYTTIDKIVDKGYRIFTTFLLSDEETFAEDLRNESGHLMMLSREPRFPLKPS